jgi:hypothetical protein
VISEVVMLSFGCISRKAHNTRAKYGTHANVDQSSRGGVIDSADRELFVRKFREMKRSWKECGFDYRGILRTIKLGLGSILRRWVRPIGSDLSR